MSELIKDKKVWLEYDRYQDDKYGRVLAWIWIDCEIKPKFLLADYMRLLFNRLTSSDTIIQLYYELDNDEHQIT